MLNRHLSISFPDLVECDNEQTDLQTDLQTNLQANLQTNLQANLQADLQTNGQNTSDKQQILTYYEFSFDEFGRTVKGDRKIITDLENLKPDYLQSLKMKIPQEFHIKKKKEKVKVRELVAILCRDQFVTKRALAELLGMSESGLRLHLKEFVEQGMLELAFPQQPTHQDQSYHLRADK